MPKARRPSAFFHSRRDRPLGVFKKIGLLGGTFDPPHLAHLVLAQTALEQLELDAVWFLPSFIPPLKRDKKISSFTHRLRMVRLAIRGNRRFGVSVIEKEKKGTSYTVATLVLLCEKHPDVRFYLILGSDNLDLFKKWKEPEKVFSMAAPVFARRPNFSEKAPTWLKHAAWLDTPRLEISSTNLHARVSAGHSIRYLVPDAVEKYIRKNHLYL